jgi:lytic murein transglycosylase
MTFYSLASRLFIAAFFALIAMDNAFAQNAACRNTGSFDTWLSAFKQEAVSAGISQRTMAAAGQYLTFDQGIINRDRGQRVFGQTFLKFSDRMAAKYRMDQGRAKIKTHAAIFAQVEKQYGVPPSVIAAFWALESDFGANMGDLSSLRSLTTLAYDCRRSAMFREELMAALKVVERGDLAPAEMIGSWAGELGQTQFLPVLYVKYAVDFDGDGKRNLLKSPADVIASTANYIADIGWKRGQPWLQEVRVPAQLPWEQAGLDIAHPRAKWAQWGVTKADGKPLPSDDVPASLLLPMGRTGPAFLAYDNFKIYTIWNNSLTYATTAAYLATRIDGAGAMHRGAPQIPELAFNDLRAMQQALAKRGYDVGKIDGILGQKTRNAIRDEQKKAGLPADSWPTRELMAALRIPVSAPPADAAAPEGTPAAPKRARPAAPRPTFEQP